VVKFRPDVEGLRAVAIIPVVAYHACGNLVPGGFIGVDVFFVISGFLISKIILDGIEDGSFSYASFYRRRIRRIFPALFFMLAFASLFAGIILSPQALIEFGKTLAATALFVSNMEFYRLSGYFGGTAEFKPLLHTWSLAVEEQFYIIFPIVLMITKRWFKGRFLVVFLAGAAASILLSAWLVTRSSTAAFYFGPARAFELLMGAILALNVLPQLSSRVAREIIAAAGLGMIVLCALVFDETAVFQGPSAFLPCLGAAAIIYSGQTGTSATAKVLSWPVIRFIGAISYSLYLWHWPMLSLVRNYYIGDVTPFQTACAVLVAGVMAIFSWHFVERPFRSSARRDKPIFGAAAAVMTGAGVLSAAIILSSGFPERFPAASQRLFRYSGDFNHRRELCNDAHGMDVPYARSCYYGASDARAAMAVWGDSHGVELAVALGEALGPGRSVMEVTSSSCPPALDFSIPERPDCAAHNQGVFKNLVRDSRVHSVILVAYYSFYLGKWPKFQRGIEKVVAGLVASGKQVIVVYPTPVFPYPAPDALGLIVAHGLPAESFHISLSQYRKENARVIAELDAVTAKFGLPRIATQNVFCGRQYCQAYDGRDVLFYDEHHMSISGARKLVASIKPLLAASPRSQ